MNNINDFPIDDELKELVTNIVSNQLIRIDIGLTEREQRWFNNECAGELIANILDSVTRWTNKKLN